MQQIIAIALLSIRSAIRSKIVLTLLALLLAVIVLLPLSIQGDGSTSGLIQITLSYTLGLAGIILALTTLWAGSAAVSFEIADKTIQMVAAKPVTRLQIWAGKWIGLSLMNAVILIVCGVTTYAMLNWHLRHPGNDTHIDPEEAARLLSARIVVQPDRTDLDAEVQDRLAQLLRNQGLPRGTTVDDAERTIRRQLTTERNTVSPGGRKTWNFGEIDASGVNGEVTLQFRFSSSTLGQSPVKGRWLIGTPEQPSIISREAHYMPRLLNEITFPVDHAWDARDLVVRFENIEETPVSLIFDERNVQLLTPHGGFAGNYIRALSIMYGQLTFLTALGVTAGCLFSLPVASFISCFVLMLVQMGGYIQNIAATKIILPGAQTAADDAMTWTAIAIAVVFKGLAFVMRPLIQGNVLEFISGGKLISWSWTFNGLVLQGLLYALLMGIAASWILNRRELALPST